MPYGVVCRGYACTYGFIARLGALKFSLLLLNITLQNQRRLEQENEARKRAEMLLLDKEREIDSMRRRGQEINRDSAQSTERLALVEKAVSSFPCCSCW